MELEPDGIAPSDDPLQAGRDAVVAHIEDLLDEERFEEGLAAIDAALAQGDGNPLDLRYLAGDAWLALGRGREAEQQFRGVLAIDPDCPASRCWLGMSLFLQWRFDEAEVAVAAAIDLPGALPDAHVVRGALLERRGEWSVADACFARANAMAPDRHPLPIRMSRAEFDREVKKAARKLPRQFRQALDRVPIIVQDIPDESLAHGPAREELAPDLLGLFDGIPLTETDSLDIPDWRPSRIFLFQRNLERVVIDRDDLIDQIRITLWHEIGHYLGFEEDDMDDLGLA